MAFSFQPKTVTDGLVLCLDAANVKSYPGSGTTWADLSSTATSGSLLNGATFNSATGSSISFDGTNDQVSVFKSNIFNQSPSKTIETWVNAGSISGSFTIISTDREGGDNTSSFILFTDDRSVVRPWNSTGLDRMVLAYQIGTGSGATTAFSKDKLGTTNGDNQWHQIVGVTDTTQNRIFLYYDGIQLHTSSFFGTPATPTASIRIGSGYINGTSDQPFSGKIASFKIYNRALSPTEVLQNYNAICGRFGKTPTITDGDALSFVNAANISNETQQSAINTLVTDLKGAGIWSKMKAIYPFVGGTAASHKWNLKDPRDLDAAFRLTFIGGITHSSTGMLGNGTNGYANTYLKPATDLALADNQMSIYLRTNNSVGTADVGCYDVSGGITQFFQIYSRLSGRAYGASGNNSNISFANTDSRGFYLLSKGASSTFNFYKNLNKTLTNSAGGAYIPNVNVYLSARNANGVAEEFGNREISFATFGNFLTDADAANLYTIVQKYQTTLGRQV